MRTFSKAHGMAGMRIGYAIAPAELVATFDKIRHHFGVSRLAQEAALASLGDRAFHRRRRAQRRRRAATTTLASPRGSD